VVISARLKVLCIYHPVICHHTSRTVRRIFLQAFECKVASRVGSLERGSGFIIGARNPIFSLHCISAYRCLGANVLDYASFTVSSKGCRITEPMKLVPGHYSTTTHDTYIFTAQCTLVQCAVLGSHVVRLSVCLSVTLVICDHI